MIPEMQIHSFTCMTNVYCKIPFKRETARDITFLTEGQICCFNFNQKIRERVIVRRRRKWPRRNSFAVIKIKQSGVDVITRRRGEN